MAEYITKIRTEDGDLPIYYGALYGVPDIVAPSSNATTGQIADAKAVDERIKSVEARITEIQGGGALAGITINGKSLSSNPVLTANDVGAAATYHDHSADDIKSGVLPIERGGTDASDGSEGLKNLLASGPMILTSGKQYGTQAQFDELKTRPAEIGQIFFLKMQ